MTTYAKEEILPSTKVARNFGTILNKLKKHELEKVAVIRNNEIEAVIISINEYEAMKDILELQEHIDIYNMIKVREKTPKEEYISFDTILKEAGIKKDEL